MHRKRGDLHVALTDETLIRFLRDDLALDTSGIHADTLLFSSGVIDSFALINLMTMIETEGGVRISPADVNLANFDSIERILKYAGRIQA